MRGHSPTDDVLRFTGMVRVPVVLLVAIVAVWSMVISFLDQPQYQPSAESMQGIYIETDGETPPARIELHADHTMRITGLTSYNGDRFDPQCKWNGTGIWAFSGSLGLKVIEPAKEGSPPACIGRWVNGGFEVLGRHEPFRLFMPIGDPDTHRGLTFMRQGSFQ